MNETKIKGLTTELQCQLFFTKLGYNVSVPLGEDCKYDFILDVDNVLIRIQVKTCHINKSNAGIEFSCRSTQGNGSMIKNTFYSKESIDFFATFYNEQCYLVPVEECSSSKTLSFSNKRVNQNPVCFIENYEAEKQIDKYINHNDDLILSPESDRTIYQYDLRKNLINTFSSCREAAKSLGDESKNSHISACVRGERNTAYGYIWKDTLIKS